jgi:hypothetical protein
MKHVGEICPGGEVLSSDGDTTQQGKHGRTPSLPIQQLPSSHETRRRGDNSFAYSLNPMNIRKR